MKSIKNIILLSALSAFTFSYSAKLVMTYRDAGFFSNFIQVLNYLYYCDQQKTKPAIHWGADCYYYDKNGWNSITNNAWEYYFEPVSNARYEKNDTLYNNYWNPNGFTFVAAASPYINQDMRQLGKKIIDTYIKIKPATVEKIDDFDKRNFSNRYVVGIHYRGTDKITDGEAKFVDMANIISIANNHAAQHVGIKVFYIATDQTSFIEYAKRHLNGIVTYYDSFRSSDSKPIHRKPSMAQLGEEALIDMVLLSRCNMLIRTASNLSVSSLIFNPSLPDILVLGRSFIKDYKD